MKPLFFFLLFLMVSCASKSITGSDEREPVAPEDVVLYFELPEQCEIIGVVGASSRWGLTAQQSVDIALWGLRRKAAALGANGILIEDLSQERVATIPFVFHTVQKITGKALVVGGDGED